MATRTGVLQVANVARVQQIEAAVGKYDGPDTTGGPQRVNMLRKLFTWCDLHATGDQ
jgi:hypothetical protein